MGRLVQLSARSQELINQFLAVDLWPSIYGLGSSSITISEVDLVCFLSADAPFSRVLSISEQKKMEFLLAALRVELFRDLLISIGVDTPALDESVSSNNSTNRYKFYLIAAAGTLVAVCEGFDSISTLLSVLALPPVVILLCGLAFSMISVMVFYGYSLVQVSQNLGVKLTDAPKLLDLYIEQLNQVKSLRKKIATYKLAQLSLEELGQLKQLICMLDCRVASLSATSQQFAEALNSPKIQSAKTVFGGVAGVLFFCSGFFAGQSVAAFILGLFLVGITPASLPVVLFSLAIGVAAFGLYWYVEKVGLEKLISGWFGLDEDKISELCDPAQVSELALDLNNLKEQVDATAILKRELELLQNKVHVEKGRTFEPLSSKTQTNIYAFHQPEAIKIEENEEEQGYSHSLCRL